MDPHGRYPYRLRQHLPVAYGGTDRFSRIDSRCSISLIAEAFIQFTTWWRRLLWIFAGMLTIALALYFFLSTPLDAYEFPVRIRGPVFFLLPSILEFVAASGARKHSWIWVAMTPLLLGFLNDWGLAVLEGVDVVLLFLESHGVVLTRQLPEFYAVAAIFGAIFFTRALIGSFIASRIPSR